MRGKRARLYLGFAGLVVALLGLFVLNVNSGSVSLSPGEIWAILLARGGDNGAIVWNIRLPRILAAALLGGALALSGFLLQTFFANPIAGPFILGISFYTFQSIGYLIDVKRGKYPPVTKAETDRSLFRTKTDRARYTRGNGGRSADRTAKQIGRAHV